MKRFIKYNAIQSVIYQLNESELNAAAVLYLQNETDIFIRSKKPQSFVYEWCDTDNGHTYLEIHQKIIESESEGE